MKDIIDLMFTKEQQANKLRITNYELKQRYL
jgi:hypothetical protein